MTRPLALTLGEPAGIGPDITLGAWQNRRTLSLPSFYVLGDPDFLQARARLLGLDVPIAVVEPHTAAPANAAAAVCGSTTAIGTSRPSRRARACRKSGSPRT